jgi:hypothetical protein
VNDNLEQRHAYEGSPSLDHAERPVIEPTQTTAPSIQTTSMHGRDDTERHD